MTRGPYTSDERQRALDRLFRFAGRPRFRSSLAEAETEFWADWEDADVEEVRFLMGEQVEIYFNAWIVFDVEVKAGKTLIDLLLAEMETEMSPGERAFLRRARDSHVRPYDVERVDPDRGLALRDLWSDEQLYVEEKKATAGLQAHDFLAARIVEGPNGKPVIEGGLLHFPPHEAAEVLSRLRGFLADLREDVDPEPDEIRFFKLAAPLFHDEWIERVVLKRPPDMVTPEGDPLVFVKARWVVTDQGRVAQALDASPEMESVEVGERWMWFEPLSDEARRGLGEVCLSGERLTLETMSRQRTARGRSLIEELAGDSLRFVGETEEDLDAIAERAAAEAPDDAESAIPAEIRSQMRHECLSRHYRDWADTKLPALGGRTPRQAMKSRDGRERVLGLVRRMERTEAEAARRGEEPFDFGWLREDLGLGPEPSGVFRYDPLEAPDTETWLAMDDGEKSLCIEEYHEGAGDPLPNPRLHAAIHAIVENQIAMGEEIPVRATLDRLMREGLDRHDAIHAIGSALGGHMHGAWSGELVSEEIQVRYFEALGELTAEGWRASGTQDPS